MAVMMRRKFVVVIAFFTVITLGFSFLVSAQDSQPSGFSLQVTPSPLISSIEPGTRTSLDLKIRNASSTSENLKIELRSFSIDDETGGINISKETANNVADFVSFEKDVFQIEGGQWYTQKVNIDAPEDAGFSYSFVILISRNESAPATGGTTSIEGSIAIFTLLNTNRPDAVKKLDLSNFVSIKKSYEYLPAEFETSVYNSGNTIIQPKGNIFIGRGENDQEPLAVLKINPNDGYIIPNSKRVLKTQWNDGFPSRDENGKLVWDWSKLSKLRVGRYTAKAILIYDDGLRDVPIEATATFWVLPWKILLIGLVILLLIIIGLYTMLKRVFKAINVRKNKILKSKS